MSERNKIKELAGMALDQALPQTWTTLTAYDLDKFTGVLAELIVRECAGIIESQDVDPTFKHRMSWAIRKHFGVKE